MRGMGALRLRRSEGARGSAASPSLRLPALHPECATGEGCIHLSAEGQGTSVRWLRPPS